MRRWLGLLVLLSVMGCPGASWAEVVVQDLDRNLLPVRLDAPVNTLETKAGQPLSVTLSEPVRYADLTLPADTVFRGQLTEVRASKRLARPPLFRLEFQELCRPDRPACEPLADVQGKRVGLYPYDPNRDLRRLILLRQVPLSALSYGISLILYLTTDLGFWPSAAIEQGAGLVVGALAEAIKPLEPQRNLAGRLGYGALSSTSIPVIYGLARKPTNFTVEPGQVISLHLPPEVLQRALQSPAPGPTDAPVQPVGEPVSQPSAVPKPAPVSQPATESAPEPAMTP